MRASHTPIELPFNQPKSSRKTRKNSQKNSLEENKFKISYSAAMKIGPVFRAYADFFVMPLLALHFNIP